MYKYIKRFFDILISLIFLPILIFIIGIVSLLIKVEDNGPVFYLAKRIGQNKKVFKMYKFRSMKVNAEDIRYDDGSTFNAINDPRVTKIGKIIRKTSIDELPQLINVLKGDMSFVGPRPDLVDWANKYVGEENLIHNVKPGITGYNQAKNRNSTGTKEKLINDIYYVKHMSFIFDFKIILMTIKTVLSSENIYRDGDCNNG